MTLYTRIYYRIKVHTISDLLLFITSVREPKDTLMFEVVEVEDFRVVDSGVLNCTNETPVWEIFWSE